MVRFLVDRIYDDTAHYVECAGMSTDTKPIGGFVTGSKFFEVDTGNEFAYDEHGEQWHMTAIGSAAGST